MSITRRRLMLAGPLAVLASCASLPASVEVSKKQIEAALARRFPFETRSGELLNVKIGTPAVELLPDQNRVRLTSSFDVAERIARNAVHAELAVSFGLRYEASDATLRLTDVRIEQVDVENVPPLWQRALEKISQTVGASALDGVVLHRFTPEQLARAQGRRPGEIRVTSTGIRVELLPAL